MNQLLALRVFVRVAEAGSFTRAADQLSLPRSTVSKLIADLEQHLGVRLVQRTTRQVMLTPEGADYLASVAALVVELDEADARVRGRRLEPQGRLRVDVTSSFANLFLIGELPDFRRRYPGLVLELGISDRTIDVVGEGADCAIRVGALADTTLIAKHLLTAETVLCASPEYLTRRGTPTTAEELIRDHDLVGYFVAATARPMTMRLERGKVAEEIRAFSVLANESTGHVGMMVAGLGVGQTALPSVRSYLASGRLVTVLDDWRQPAVAYHLLYPPNRHQSTRLRVFKDWIVERIAATGFAREGRCGAGKCA